MIRSTSAVIAGIALAIALTYLLPATLGSTVVRYASLLVGGGVAGFICEKKGWLLGGIVGLVVSATVAMILADIAMEGSGGRVGATAEMRLPWLLGTATIAGAPGGLIAQLLRRRLVEAETS